MGPDDQGFQVGGIRGRAGNVSLASRPCNQREDQRRSRLEDSLRALRPSRPVWRYVRARRILARRAQRRRPGSRRRTTRGESSRRPERALQLLARDGVAPGTQRAVTATRWTAAGALLGGLSVVLGAFAAHGLKGRFA